MKIIFMGTPEFAVPALEKIKKEGYEVCAVITQPDKPKGRGKKVQYTPVKKKALELEIPVMQPSKVKDTMFIKEIERLKADCIVVAAYGQILPEMILNLPKYGCINIHASILPKYRGAAPIHWSIINGERETGITIMQMDKGLDTGDILLQKSLSIVNKTTGETHDLLAELGGELVIEALHKIEDGTIKRIKQKNEDATYAVMLDKKLAKINWSKSPIEIERLVRGLNPWPKAYTLYEGQMVKILEAVALEKACDLSNGTISAVSSKGIEVAASGKLLLITKIQFPNKKVVTVDEYLRGNEIKIGIQLGMEE